MKSKYFVLFVVLTAIFLSGCTEQKEASPSDETGVSGMEAVNTTSQANSTVSVNDTAPVDATVSVSATEPSNETDPSSETVSADASREYIVRLEMHSQMIPASLDINKGDTVSWWSYRRQGTFVLVSEDQLFPDQPLTYKGSYKYSFPDAGTYRFTIADTPSMNLTVNVK